MRLSDAIVLGSMMLSPCAGGGDGVSEGCALDMACAAVGVKVAEEDSGMPLWVLARTYWPWLRNIAPSTAHWDMQIAMKFDRAVMGRGNNGIATMSLDQFIDYVRCVEPAEQVPATEGERGAQPTSTPLVAVEVQA